MIDLWVEVVLLSIAGKPEGPRYPAFRLLLSKLGQLHAGLLLAFESH